MRISSLSSILKVARVGCPSSLPGGIRLYSTTVFPKPWKISLLMWLSISRMHFSISGKDGLSIGLSDFYPYMGKYMTEILMRALQPTRARFDSWRNSTHGGEITDSRREQTSAEQVSSLEALRIRSVMISCRRGMQNGILRKRFDARQ
jgi:hypothetical protein